MNDNIRPAKESDVSRLAEIEIFNYRLNFYPIFRNDSFYFGDLQVADKISEYLRSPEKLKNTSVYDDGVVKGFVTAENSEVKKLFIEPVLQGQGIGAKLLDYAVTEMKCEFLWALEKNIKAIAFYERNGFYRTSERKLEEDTDEYLIKLGLLPTLTQQQRKDQMQ